MISNDIEYRQTKDTLEQLEGALVELKNKLADKDAELFKVFAADYIKDINRLRQEVDEYTGLALVENK